MFKKFTAFDQIPKESQPKALELKDGSFVVDEPDEVSTRLENSVKETRRERDDAQKELREEREAHSETKRQLDVKSLSGKDIDAQLTARMVEWKKEQDAIREAEKKPLLEKIAKLEGRTTVIDRDDKLKEAFKAAGGDEKKYAPMLRYAKEDWHLVDGKLVRKDADGNIMSTSLEDYFKVEYLAVQPENYIGTQADGGGAGGQSKLPVNDSKKDAKPDKPITQWTPDERQAFKEANGGGAVGQKAFDAAMAQHMRDGISNPKGAAAAAAA